jgi:SAM-dependent methyltransferase
MPRREHIAENRRYWDAEAVRWAVRGERNWAMQEPAWGEWEVPESQLAMLPPDMTGMLAVELGCGTAYVSAWMARRGARVVGIDNSAGQLATAQRLVAASGLDVSLVHGDAEVTPCPDGVFDFAISEYGAAIWCDPLAWVPEAHRLLRPGGALVMLGTSPLASVCAPLDGSIPITEHLARDYFSLHRLDWREAVDEPGGIEFNLPVSRWFRLFRDTGFEVEDYVEVQSPETGSEVHDYVTADWAHRYPSEQVWKLRKAPAG